MHNSIMNTEADLQARGLCYRYEDKIAVEALDISLQAGDILGFLGPNGAGKTTTLNMLSGCLRPVAGQIRLCGLDMQRSARQARAHLGYAPEIPPLYPDLQVREYLRFTAQLRRVTTSQLTAAVQRVLSDYDLQAVAHQRIDTLSKGYRQRLGLAQAIVHDPDVIILDEPTDGLDPSQIRRTRELIRTLGKKRAVLISSHNLSEIEATCTRVQILQHGRSVYSARMDDSIEAPVSTLVAFQQTPDLRALSALPGIASCEPLSDKRIRLHHQAGFNTAPLVQLSSQSQWGLVLLQPETRGLEDIFIDITTGRTEYAA
ncbi:MAG TPA: ABC transporter ATP-binding protein [Gammaproteobacteria bacterium]|nr:ABC transporter ATP-binding protein [Gammaproteobacteria bacterium]